MQGTAAMEARFEALCEYKFTLPDSTHKQDDRMYVQLVVNDDPQSDLRMLWRYTGHKPSGVDGRDFETVIDADEAFAIVQRRNARLRREVERVC